MNTDIQYQDILECPLVSLNNLTLETAANKVQYLATQPRFSYVVTPNVDHLARLARSAANDVLVQVYQQADLCLCDSRILEKLLRLRGKLVREVIPGSTLTHHLFDHVLSPDDRVLILGVEDAHIDHLRQRYPSLDIHHINPSMGFINKPEEVEALIEEIKALAPHYIFFSVGSPRQEILAHKIKTETDIGGVGLCVGASILFLVGAEKRAPQMIQALHLEWAYRMSQDPGRLVRRYGGNFLALPSIYKKL